MSARRPSGRFGAGPAGCTKAVAPERSNLYIHRFLPEDIDGPGPFAENGMRAEIENLVEEIKQSVGLLRRHL
jgi:hypothetical protein